jgi:hypothetical protein
MRWMSAGDSAVVSTRQQAPQPLHSAIDSGQ